LSSDLQRDDEENNIGDADEKTSKTGSYFLTLLTCALMKLMTLRSQQKLNVTSDFPGSSVLRSAAQQLSREFQKHFRNGTLELYDKRRRFRPKGIQRTGYALRSSIRCDGFRVQLLAYKVKELNGIRYKRYPESVLPNRLMSVVAEAIVSVFGANPLAITFPESSSPSLLDLKQHLFDLYHIPIEDQRIQTAGGLSLSTGNNDDDDKVLLFDESGSTSNGIQPKIKCFGLSGRLSGGKGGFGSMLRAQGGRMSSQKSTNTDACRDLSGRRIKTVNEAKKMAEYMQKEPERERAKKESLKRKIEEKLELAERPTRKHRFEDSKFFDEAEEQVEEVKNAVAEAIKKAGTVDVKGKGKAKEVIVEKKEKKPVAKSLGMWDDMSDYESSEGEEEDEEEEGESGDSDVAEVPSVGSSSSTSSSSSRSAKTSKAKGK
ncbi:hypothetical protein BGZ65_010522, partial [Modicella reniformis]